MNRPNSANQTDSPTLWERLAEKHGIHVDRHRDGEPVEIGRGTFSTAYAGRIGTDPGRPCAIKRWNEPVSPDDKALAAEEKSLIDLHSGEYGSNPNVVTLLKGPLQEFDHRNDLRLVTVWELADRTKPTLQHVLDQSNGHGLPRETVVQFLTGIASALDDLADAGHTHRDVKPANIMLFGRHPKLGDLGLAKAIGASTLQTAGAYGTLPFMPPEAIERESLEVSPTFDGYSFGVTYAYLRTGRLSFSDQDKALRQKQKGKMDLAGLDKDEIAFVRALCAPDRNNRPKERLSDLFTPLRAATKGIESDANNSESRNSARQGKPKSGGLIKNLLSTLGGLLETSSSAGNQNRKNSPPENTSAPADPPDKPVPDHDPEPERIAAHQALVEVTNAYTAIETELEQAEAKRTELLKDIVPTGKAVRDQDIVINEIMERLTSQKQTLTDALTRRDALDASMVAYIEGLIAERQRELARLTDEDGEGFRNHHPRVVECTNRIHNLEGRKLPYLSGRLRAQGKGEPIDLLPFCIDELFSGGEVFTEQRACLSKVLRVEPRHRHESAVNIGICWCPAGAFLMGDSTRQVHTALSQGFWMMDTLVTQELWQSVMETSFRSRALEAGWNHREYERSHPMHFVSHDEASEFGEKLTANLRTNGKLVGSWQFQLPTDAQWEYACRAGSTTRFYWGDKESDVHSYAWTPDIVTDVCRGRPNAWGLFDMSGLMQEWVADWWDNAISGGIDPIGPSSGPSRVCRNGGYGDSVEKLESSYRSPQLPSKRSHCTGFRLACCRVAGPTEQLDAEGA